MSTGNINLDILLNEIRNDAISNFDDSVKSIQKRFPSLSEKEAREIHSLVIANSAEKSEKIELIVTAPPSFAIKTKSTKMLVEDMIRSAKHNITITGYSLSDYFEDLIECIIRKSKQGVFVKIYANDIESQKSFNELIQNKGKFLKIYNYPKKADKMSALHAKVISVDSYETLITSANLSYHGQEGNIELGTHIYSEEIAKQVDDIFTNLLFSKILVEV